MLEFMSTQQCGTEASEMFCRRVVHTLNQEIKYLSFHDEHYFSRWNKILIKLEKF